MTNHQALYTLILVPIGLLSAGTSYTYIGPPASLRSAPWWSPSSPSAATHWPRRGKKRQRQLQADLCELLESLSKMYVVPLILKFHGSATSFLFVLLLPTQYGACASGLLNPTLSES